MRMGEEGRAEQGEEEKESPSTGNKAPGSSHHGFHSLPETRGPEETCTTF